MFFKKLLKQQSNAYIFAQRRTVKRSEMILPCMVNKIFYVHSGKKFRKLSIVRSHVGFKFGEFCFTRRLVKHKAKKKKAK